MKEVEPNAQLEKLAHYLADEELMLAEKNVEPIRLYTLKTLAFLQIKDGLSPYLAPCQVEISLLTLRKMLLHDPTPYRPYITELEELLQKEFTQAQFPIVEALLEKMLKECFTGDLSERFIIKTLK